MAKEIKFSKDARASLENGVNKPVQKQANIIKEKYGLEKESYILYYWAFILFLRNC